MPRDALALLPGYGDAGAALVRDPRVHMIAFTGSSAVGLEILRAAAETPEGQGHVKRVVAEMGGKNCVIVDADADLDEAVPGDRRTRPSATPARSARRPRACSCTRRSPTRCVERLAGATEVLRVGPGRRASPPTCRR